MNNPQVLLYLRHSDVLHLRLIGSSPFTLASLPDDFAVFFSDPDTLPRLCANTVFLFFLLPLICLPDPLMCFNTFIFAGFVLSQSSPVIWGRDGSFWPVNHTACFEVRNKGGGVLVGVGGC